LILRRATCQKGEQPIAETNFVIEFENVDTGERIIKELTISIFELSHISRIRQHLNHQGAAMQILHETVLQQVANLWEKVLGAIVAAHISTNPEFASKDESLSYSKLLDFNSFDDVKKFIIDRQVESFLKKLGTEDQLKYLHENLKADIKCNCNWYAEFLEVLLRRHAIVHGGGRATKEYIRRVARIPGLGGKKIEEDSMLPLTASYVSNAWELLYSTTVILIHLVKVGNARTTDNDELNQSADAFLHDASYQAVKNKQYDAAEKILSYAYKRTLGSTTSKFMVAVNLAQTMLWKGMKESCEKILNEVDWSAANSTFKICVAALRDDTAEVIRLLPIIKLEGEMGRHDFFEWPVFKEIRKKSEFITAINHTFGDASISPFASFEPKVISDFPNEEAKAMIALMETLMSEGEVEAKSMDINQLAESEQSP
jgi:hypothetical protein